MKKLLIIGIVLIGMLSSAFAEVGFRGRPITNNLSMPTGYTLNQNEFVVGIGPIGFGITDNIQVGTNILLYLFQVYNGNIKVSFIKTKSMALAGGLSIYHFSWGVGTGDIGFTSLSPYLVISQRIGPNTLLHIGGQYSHFSANADIDDVKADATVAGTRFYAGVEHSLSRKTKFLAEGGYDIDFKGFMFGGAVLFGWEKFRLKLGLSYYAPEAADNGFTLPAIGLWWRFKA
jgi:hypothetical protein